MMDRVLGIAALLAVLLVPAAAIAAGFAVATTDVNLRAGPSTLYPAVDVVPYGDNVRVYGCLSSRAWCDVSYAGERGWMSSNYIAFVDGGRRYIGTPAVDLIAPPIVSFSVGSYWDNYYRDRPFYRDRARWEAPRYVDESPRYEERRYRRVERQDDPDENWRDQPRWRDRGEGRVVIGDDGEFQGADGGTEREFRRRRGWSADRDY